MSNKFINVRITACNETLSFWRVKPLPLGGGYKRRDAIALLVFNKRCWIFIEI